MSFFGGGFVGERAVSKETVAGTSQKSPVIKSEKPESLTDQAINMNFNTNKDQKMSFLKGVKNALNATREELTTQVGRFKNRKFLEGTVAVCAIIAMGNGEIKAEEKQKMVQFMQNSPELKVFDTQEIIEFFGRLVQQFEFDYDIGKGEALKHILALKDQPDQAQLAVRVGIAVARSDGEFDDEEQRLAKVVISSLGFNASDFGL